MKYTLEIVKITVAGTKPNLHPGRKSQFAERSYCIAGTWSNEHVYWLWR